MQLHAIDEREKTMTNTNNNTVSLPRVNYQFIGLGHELESYRKQRRQVQQQHQVLENRVLLLEKQEQKARRDLLKKKKHLQHLIYIRQRQQQDNEEKVRIRQQRMEELQRLRKQNQFARIMHKNNYENNASYLRDRNQSDYSRIRQARLDGQYAKRMKKDNDLQQKRDNWISLNLSKQKGKVRIDQFYKKKNRQHIKEYQSRIQVENQQKQSRMYSIKNLEARQQSLRTKLQSSHMKNSKMEQLIRNISRTLSPMNTHSIQQQLYHTSRAKKSYETFDNQFTQQQRQQNLSEGNKNSPNNEENLVKNKPSSNPNHKSHHVEGLGQHIEENIQLGDEQQIKNGVKIIHKRRKNKHVNRYKQYEAY